MAYQKQTWVDYPDTSSPLTAERLNHMEDGIEEAWNHGGGGGAGETLPIGSEIDFDGNVSDIPDGWEQVDDVPVYSTSETVCGTWIDGKLIYRKVINITSYYPNGISADSQVTFQHNISNFEALINVRIIRTGSNPLEYKSLRYIQYITDNSRNEFNIYASNYGLSIGSNQTLYLIVEYTKSS